MFDLSLWVRAVSVWLLCWSLGLTHSPDSSYWWREGGSTYWFLSMSLFSNSWPSSYWANCLRNTWAGLEDSGQLFYHLQFFYFGYSDESDIKKTQWFSPRNVFYVTFGWLNVLYFSLFSNINENRSVFIHFIKFISHYWGHAYVKQHCTQFECWFSNLELNTHSTVRNVVNFY